MRHLTWNWCWAFSAHICNRVRRQRFTIRETTLSTWRLVVLYSYTQSTQVRKEADTQRLTILEMTRLFFDSSVFSSWMKRLQAQNDSLSHLFTILEMTRSFLDLSAWSALMATSQVPNESHTQLLTILERTRRFFDSSICVALLTHAQMRNDSDTARFRMLETILFVLICCTFWYLACVAHMYTQMHNVLFTTCVYTYAYMHYRTIIRHHIYVTNVTRQHIYAINRFHICMYNSRYSIARTCVHDYIHMHRHSQTHPCTLTPMQTNVHEYVSLCLPPGKSKRVISEVE